MKGAIQSDVMCDEASRRVTKAFGVLPCAA
jgi:hypothetical protein